MKKVRISINILYYFSFIMIVFLNYIGHSKISELYPSLLLHRNKLILISVLLLSIKILCGEIKKRNILIMCSLIILITIIYFNINNVFIYLNFLVLILLIFGLRGIQLRNIIKIWIIEIGILMFFNQILFLLGYLPDLLIVRSGQERSQVGYIFTSLGANYAFQFTLIYLLYREINVKYLELILLFLLNYYFYFQTDTKSAYYFSLLVLLLLIVIKNIKISFKVSNLINKYILLIGIIIPSYFSYFYDPNKDMYNEINQLLTGRLYLGNLALNKNGISLFGQPQDWVLNDKVTVDNPYFYVDSSFLTIAMYYGVILLSIIVFGYYILGNHKYIKGNIVYTVIFSVLVLHATFDPQFLEIVYNPMLLYLGLLFHDNIVSD